ncbi:S-layer homology domain-containing protein [Paenibacillus allorhizosphaerae]|uniref:SLH domain-containing protein n=1 Tax=Paenibacillus allorhizosphaerae TaxID=2849866 RepID=A0ABM8VKI0_9BACL|nr:S-layer homology domain-containing protein [Paenibacillus allorhizosphaerae]CAG7646960.1 hypothetical protein PAECIP111802_03874 [Paenibacillus allorhizosphaerae]
MIRLSLPMRRLLVAMLIASVMLSLWPSQTVRAEASFSDVDARYDWAVRSIGLMADKQVLTGYPDGRFRPELPVSKAEWTVMVYRLFDRYRPNLYVEGPRKIGGFADVPAQYWAYKEISELYDTSFSVGGYGLNRSGELAFRPDKPLTRLQLAQLLYAFFDNRLIDWRLDNTVACSVVSELKDIPTKIYASQAGYDAATADGRYMANGLMNVDSDDLYITLMLEHESEECTLGSDPLSNVQTKALASLKANGIMTPDEFGFFRPQEPVTRAEAVTILDRAYHFLERNDWLFDYSSINLDGTGPVGGSTNPGTAGQGSSGGGTFNNNPDSNVIIPPGGGSGGGTGGSNSSWSDKSIIRVQDYFNEKGVIVKDVRNNGELEAAVQPKGKKYLTVDLKSKEKVDLYIILDGKIAFVKQEEFPLTLSVAGVSIVGFRSQQRSPDPNVRGELNVTLSVSLLEEEPVKKKK